MNDPIISLRLLPDVGRLQPIRKVVFPPTIVLEQRKTSNLHQTEASIKNKSSESSPNYLQTFPVLLYLFAEGVGPEI